MSKPVGINIPPPPTPSPIAGVKKVILVAAGKGGVGKSTVAANLAIALAKAGYKTGLVDADIYGPSIAHMMGLKIQPEIEDNQMIPPIAFGVKCMSMGFLLDEAAPVVWRGPMISKALYQLLRAAKWGELDYMIIDMPPGTGDISLSIVQNFTVAGAVIVTTPQDLAVLDVQKCIAMLRKVNVGILGLVENMAFFEDAAGNKHNIFGSGGAQKLVENLGVEILAQLALEPQISARGEIKTIPEKIAGQFAQIVKKISEKLPV